MRSIFIAGLLILLCCTLHAQDICITGETIDTVVNGQSYYKPDSSWLQKFQGASFIADYFYSEGISMGDRYELEIIIVDTLAMMALNAPETETFHFVEYVNKHLITKGQLTHLIQTVKAARLKQLFWGLPCPDGSGYEKTILSVRYGGTNIAGGVVDGVSDGTLPPSKWNISGNHDAVIKEMENQFSEFPALMKQVMAGQ